MSVSRTTVAAFLVVIGAFHATIETTSGDVADAWIWSGGDGNAVSWLASKDVAHHAYEQLDMVAFFGSGDLAHALVKAEGGRVDRNQLNELHLDRSVAYIEADRVAKAVGRQRDGPTVLVVDTGVDTLHPDFRSGNLAANVQAAREGGLVVGSLEQQPVVDLAGHGTHVAGIVAGSGEALGSNDARRGRYVGVYANGRVASFQASTAPQPGSDPRVDTLAALEAFDWALENRARFDIRVVSNSWGQVGKLDVGHPVNQATLRLYLQGITVAFSAGNSGSEGAGTLNRHCLPPWVLCVAAGDLSGARASFSSYGRRGAEAPAWDHPDLTAPGSFIHAAAPVADGIGTGSLQDLIAGRRPQSVPLYEDRSGTSMSTPHVAGVAGLLQAANPFLSPDQVMDILVGTTRAMADEVERVGTGYLDAREAYNLAVQTKGNRQAFMDGQQVKYAGALSGDPRNANDPVSVGYSATQTPSPLVLEAQESLFIRSPVALVLAALGAISLLLGFRWRQ